MKILHLINTLAAGGAETHLVALAREQQRRGHRVSVGGLVERVSTARSLRPDFEREGIRVVALPGESRWSPRGYAAAVELIKEEKPDILHTHLPRADFAAVLARLRGAPVPWVVSVHAVYSRSWSARWALPLLDHAWRRAGRVIAISEAVRDWLTGERGLPAASVEVIPYGIDPRPFATATSDWKQAWSLNGHRVIGTIGRLDPVKGHDVLLRAMPRVLERFPHAVLLIAGHDPFDYGKELAAQIRQLQLEPHVRLVGFQPNIPRLLRTMDVFAFASRSEGFGLAVLEAMAAGKPVVATRMAPLTEIVTEETALLAERDDAAGFAAAILCLLENPARAQQMGRAGQARVQSHFTVEAMAGRVLDLYQKLLAPR